VEYKKGWNPNEVIHTICAYANDITNSNGGYIVLGVEEKSGRPVLPPVGIDKEELDGIQQEIFQYCNLIEPRYLPRIEIVEYQDKSLIYIWCFAGTNGPFKAPNDVLAKSKDRDVKRKEYWIKPASVTTVAQQEDLFELFDKFAQAPFDNRVNKDASIEDVHPDFVNQFIIDGDSALKADIKTMSVEDKLLSLDAAGEDDTGLHLKNIGVLMFTDKPSKYIDGAKIELVWFHSPDEEASDDFTERYYTGPVQDQVRKVVDYIDNMIINEKVVKRHDRTEADRFYSYPKLALQEALVNAVLHKSYQVWEPVEIRVYMDHITIINYPGPDKYIDMDDLAAGKVKSRGYRNPRLGEMLKEIDLSQKKSTGIRKILRLLEENGSPPPEFVSNDYRKSLEVTFYAHKAFTLEELGGVKVAEMSASSQNGTLSAGGGGINENGGLFGGINGGLFGGLTTGETKVLQAIALNPAATAKTIASVTGIAVRTVERHTEKLRSQGYIKREGSKKTGRWVIVKGDGCGT
jgi:ATP-dependent DNA helicase RecG